MSILKINFMAGCSDNDFLCQINYCGGGAGYGSQLFNYWLNNDCNSSFSQFINTTVVQGECYTYKNGVVSLTCPAADIDYLLQYNSSNNLIAMQLVENLFNNYLSTNVITDDVSNPQYDNFQLELLNFCLNPALPGVCSSALQSFCGGYVREEIEKSPVLTNFCGCYTPPDQNYIQYTNATLGCTIGDYANCKTCPQGQTFGCETQPACDPLCHRSDTVQKAIYQTGTFIICPQSLCVISDVTVNLSNSTIPGGINFSSICPGCSTNGEQCLCIVAGTDVNNTMSSLGVGTDFDQFCGKSSICITEDNQGNILSAGGCTGINIANEQIQTFSYYPNIFVSIMLILIIILVLILAFGIKSDEKSMQKS